jgi:hypothetical protein
MPAAYTDTTDGSTRAAPAPDPLAEPGVDPTENPNGPVVFTLEVDGEQFAVRRRGEGDWSYDWLTGPNPGYGFGASGPDVHDRERLRERIREFLRSIDPATGYIG